MPIREGADEMDEYAMVRMHSAELEHAAEQSRLAAQAGRGRRPRRLLATVAAWWRRPASSQPAPARPDAGRRALPGRVGRQS